MAGIERNRRRERYSGEGGGGGAVVVVVVVLVVVVVVVSRQQYGKIKDSIARSETDRDNGTMNSVKPTRTEVPSM